MRGATEEQWFALLVIALLWVGVAWEAAKLLRMKRK